MNAHQNQAKKARLLFQALKDRFQFDSQKDILAVYLYGSHVYGTSTPSSDYDLLLVMRSEFETRSTMKHLEHYLSTSADNKDDTSVKVVYERDMTVALRVTNQSDFGDDTLEFECHVMSLEIYLQFLVKHKPVMMLCLWLPDSSIWHEIPLMTAFREHFVKYCINFAKIRTSFLREAEVWCFAKAKRLFMEGDKVKSLKNLIHGIRYLKFALQIIQIGTIEDWTAANSHFDDCMDMEYETFEQYSAEFRPIYDQLMVQIKQHMERIESQELGSSGCSLLQYLQNQSLQQLTRHYPVTVFALENNLLKLSYDATASSRGITSSLEPHVLDFCNNTIVRYDEENHKYNLVCVGVGKVMNQEEFLDNQFDTITTMDDHIVVVERGETCLLYFDSNEWHVTAQNDPVEQYLLQFTGGLTKIEKLFWNTFERLNYTIPDNQDEDTVFSFILHERNDRLVLDCVKNAHTFEEKSIDTYHDKYGWQYPNRLFDSNEQNDHSIQNLINNSNKLDLNLYRGVMCSITVNHSLVKIRLFIDHCFHVYMNKCKYWDLNVAEDGKSLQDLASQNNIECILNACRFCSAEPMIISSAREIVHERYTLFSTLFERLQNEYLAMCSFVNQFYSSHKCCELDPVQLHRLIKSKFPMDQTGPLFIMNKQHLTTVEEVLQQMVVKPSSNKTGKIIKTNNLDFSRMKPVVETKAVFKCWQQYLALSSTRE